MSSAASGPRCPRCRRPLAAWKLEHCVYCGEKFPADLKQGFAEPEALKWVERPSLPPDLSKKLEMLKVVPLEKRRGSRNVVTIAGILSVPIFAAIFYFTYRLVQQLSPASGLLMLVAGAGVVVYLIWIFAKARR